MTRREIATYRQKLRNILVNENDEGKRLKELKELAKEVGAGCVHTKITGSDTIPNGEGSLTNIWQTTISESELVLNINNALQTETSLVNLIYARRAVYAAVLTAIIALVATGVSAILSQRSISTAQEANKLAFESLRSPYIPWLKVISLESIVILDSNRFEINYCCKNFSNAPALNLDIKYNIPGSGVKTSDQTTSYKTAALLPNEEHPCRLAITELNKAEQIVEKFKSGKSPIGFDIHYKDIFGRRFEVHQENKYIDGKLCITNYEIDGIDDLFEEIE